MKAFLKNHLFICILVSFIAVVFIIFQIFGLSICAVQSGSMEPVIPTYSVCLVNTHVDYEDVEIGDIVVYTRASDGKQIIHRVVEITEDGMITKGDANNAPDGVSVTPDNLYARYIAHVPHVARIYNLMHSQYGIFIIAGLVILLLALELVSRKCRKA